MDGPLADPASLLGVTLLGRYRIEALIGQGGMALVYAGRHLALQREVAIKVLRQRFARRQTVVDRFLQEARAASRVRHEHIVEVTDFGSTPGGIVFMVMDRLEGETLAETIERDGRMPWSRVRGIVLQLCEALQVAHENGIVHRDVSLRNCFRLARARNPDFVKLLDFGIARVMSSETSSSGRLRRMTSDTQIMGTPEFMAPEQATRSDAVDCRSDIYALGVVLYAMLTARLPFEAATAADMMACHIYDPVPPPVVHEPSLPPVVDAIVLRALEKDPDRRFQSMTELADALRAVPEDACRETAEASASVLVSSFVPPTEQAPSRWRGARHFALAGAVVVGLGWWGWRDGARFALDGLLDAVDFVETDANDTIALRSVGAAAVMAERAPEQESEARVAASAPHTAASDSIAPATMRTAIIPPAPPVGWLDRSARASRKRPRAATPSHASSAAIEPPPAVAVETPMEVPTVEPVEPIPTSAPEPSQEYEPIDEVKNPFDQ